MRVGEIDRAEKVWSYKPSIHKTAWHGHERIIFFGPKAQAVLQPFLMKTDPQTFVFSPTEAVAEMRQHRSEGRTTPLSCGNISGSNVVRRPKRQPGEQYDAAAYRRAISRACDLAFPVPAEIATDDAQAKAWQSARRWHPHQLRHTAATEIRRQHGIEAAQAALGHATLNVTELYAEKSAEAAKAVAAAMG